MQELEKIDWITKRYSYIPSQSPFGIHFRTGCKQRKRLTNPFTDVNKNAWYYSAIEYINKNKLMYGVGDNQFDPHGHMVRAMIVTVLHRLEKMPEPKAYNTFGDVAANRYYSKAVNWAAENGIVNGYGDGNFGPNDPVTREQLAVIFMNYAKYKGYDTSKRAALETFADAKSISGWATMLWHGQMPKLSYWVTAQA